MNKTEEIEQNVKVICDNLKHVKPTSANLDYYQNGGPGPKNTFLGYDKSEYAQHLADKEENKDKRQ